MRTILALAVLITGCKPNSACGVGGGKTNEKADAIVHLADYNGPAFSELGDMEVDGDTVWFCSSVVGLNAYDASNPENLRILDKISISAGSQLYPRCQHLALAPNGDVFVTNRPNSISSTGFVAKVDGKNPKKLVEREVLTDNQDFEGLTVWRDYVLVATHDGGIAILSRDGLRELGRLTQGLTNAWQIRMVGDLAYIADGLAGLTVADFSDPLAPVWVSTTSVGGTVKDLEISGDRIWLAAGNEGVAVLDISDPKAPVLLDQVDTPGSALALAVSPKTDALYVADWNDLRLFSIADRDTMKMRAHEPLLLASDMESRTLGVAAGKGDLVFSGNWTALSSYRADPTVLSGDLDVQPSRVTLARTAVGDQTNAVVEIWNTGAATLKVTGAESKGKGLEVDLPKDSIEPGDFVTALVSWTAAKNAPFSGWFNILSDDADEPKKCVPVEANQLGFTVGDEVSDGQWLGIEGTTYTLSEHRGEVVLLAYFATF